MPTNKQRREAAQRHLQRQLERRAELARKRRRNLGIIATAVAVVVVVGAALLITGVFQGDDDGGVRGPDAEPPHRRGHDQRRRHGLLHLHARRIGQPEPEGRRHAAHARGDADPGHQHAADEHRPG